MSSPDSGSVRERICGICGICGSLGNEEDRAGGGGIMSANEGDGRKKENTHKQQYKQTVHTEQTVQIHIEHSTQCFCCCTCNRFFLVVGPL